MGQLIDKYVDIAGPDVIEHLRQLARPLAGLRLAHVNSTRVGGGVAEILHKMVPLMQELGLEVTWEIISGDSGFYECTKNFHNTLQGTSVPITESHLKAYEATNRLTADLLRETLETADVVIIHDPQPAALIHHFPRRKGKWVWRCHIDVSSPVRNVWRYLSQTVIKYDASIFSLAQFARQLPHPIYLIPPSIDPWHDKNIDLPEEEVMAVRKEFGLDPERPMVIQVSRYDRFKDPLGVIQACKIARRFVPGLQLVLAGGGASDDPEGEAVLEEVRKAAAYDPDTKVLLLPGDAHRTINALQRASDLVLQKSLKEGFGLTVTEGMWKMKPVIGGDVGGIRIQVIDHHTGFLVRTPEGAALRMHYLLRNTAIRQQLGHKAREFVRENFLITRHLREYLTLIYALLNGHEDRIELD